MDDQTETTPIPPPNQPTHVCCAPTVQATCCEPSDKAKCCHDEPLTGSCGCQ